MSCVCIYITSKRIELESPGWSGFVANLRPDKTWPICLEDVMEQSWYMKILKNPTEWEQKFSYNNFAPS